MTSLVIAVQGLLISTRRSTVREVGTSGNASGAEKQCGPQLNQETK